MLWKVVISKRAEKTLAALPKNLREHIMQGISRLKNGPYQLDLDVKPLAGRPEWRLRIGSWRVLFQIFNAEIRIIVVSISPRGDAYKNF